MIGQDKPGHDKARNIKSERTHMKEDNQKKKKKKKKRTKLYSIILITC